MTALTVYRGAREALPVARANVSWDELCEEITSLCHEDSTATAKCDLTAVGLYRLREDTSRASANVESMSDVAMLDVDTGLDLDALDARIQELGVEALVFGSPSDDPEGARKARILVRLDAEHAPADAWRVRAGVAEMLGVVCDPTSSNADRIGFVGRLAGTAPREVRRYAGAPLPIASLPAVAPRPTLPPADIALRHDPVISAAAMGIIGALGSWEDWQGKKHATCGAVGGILRKAGWRRAECEALIRAWLPEGEPDVDVSNGVRWACKAWEKPPEEVSGRQALDAAVGKDVAGIVESMATMPWRMGRERRNEAGEALPQYSTLGIVDLAQPPPPLDYVIRGLDLAQGKVSAIQAFANTSKTPFALLEAICVASGKPFLGHAVSQRPVLYLDFEGGILTQERLVRICVGLGVEAPNVPITFARCESFSDAMLDDIERIVQEKSIGLVLIDTYGSALPEDLSTFNDAGFRTWATKLGRVGDRTGATMQIVVHETKGANGKNGIRGISGHGSLAGAVQASIALSQPDEGNKFRVEVSCARMVGRGFAPFQIDWIDGENPAAPEGKTLEARIVAAAAKVETAKPDANKVRAATAAQATRVAGEAIMRDFPRSGLQVPRRELIALSGEGKRAAERALQRLVGAGLLQLAAGQYSITEAGLSADHLAIAKALGAVGDFQR